jgi:cytochrome b561
MERDELYEEIQESKTAFVIAFLVAIYCFSVILESRSVHVEWKVICSSIGFLIVSIIAIRLFVRLFRLAKASRKVLDDSN